MLETAQEIARDPKSSKNRQGEGGRRGGKVRSLAYLGSRDVPHLGLVALLTLGVLRENGDGRLHSR
jgi:hypothetical protein